MPLALPTRLRVPCGHAVDHPKGTSGDPLPPKPIASTVARKLRKAADANTARQRKPFPPARQPQLKPRE
ncbi:hypothetical protein MTO96_011131 [Rhipicephalus appendiculatus]